MRRFVTAAVMYLGVLAIAAVAVMASGGGEDPVTPSGLPEPDDIELVAALEPFEDCDALLGYFKDEALERVGPYGLGGQPMWYGDDVIMEDSMGGGVAGGGAGAAVSPTAPVAGGTAVDLDARGAVGNTAAKAFSGTNVQEEGVDEPDTVKTDGRRLVVLARERLHIFSVNPDGLRRLGALRVPGAWGNEIMLDGDRVLILGQAVGEVRPLAEPAMDTAAKMSMPVMGSPVSTFRMVDISDPSSPTVLSTLQLDGDYVSARLVDGVARVVVRSQPAALPFVMPETGGLRAEREARAENREVVRNSTIDQWLPYSVSTDERTGEEVEQTLLDCTAVHHPEEFSGFGLVSVLTVDLDAGLATDGSAGVVGAAETVYATADNLYVALNRWQDEATARAGDRAIAPAPASTTTDLHQFDISDPAAARYVASGAVNGRLLNQWALSEHDGHLRVATTTEDFTGRDTSESAVTILRADGTTLRRVGRVGGLGKTEQIYSVRFEGDTGYVVTFRQTDPLYTLDLSDPTAPRTVGELKINGYSAYLHPVADGRILGIGQDATKDGQTTGSQASLFDVTDLRSPQRLDQLDLGQGSSAVEYDHRAFTFWPATRTAVVPLQTWGRTPFSGVVVVRVGEEGLGRQGQISHAGPATNDARQDAEYCCGEGPAISRSLVIGDALVTVSEVGVMINGLDDLQRRAWAGFAPR